MTKLHGLGRIEGKTHILPISVYYEDTDLSGFVYHANYLRYMERGRTEFFRTAGISRADLEAEEPTALAIRHIEVDYHRPARLDDQIEVHTTLTGLTGARLLANQKLFCGKTLLVEGRIEACVITLTGKPRRVSKTVQETLAPFVTAADS